MMSKKNSNKIRFFGILLIIICCIGFTFKYLQNDTFYIIKLGDYIVHHGLDSIDHYSWVAMLPYTYPHWLYDVFIYYVYHFFGYFGIYVSTIVFFIVMVLIMYYILLKLTKNELLSFLVSIISCFRLGIFIVARSQVISLSLFMLEVYFIHKLIKCGKNKYIIYLCILSLLIANIHATVWLFFFVLFLPFIGEYIFYKIIHIDKVRKLYHLDSLRNSRILIEKISNIKKLFLSFLLCFLMGVFTPSRICYTYVFKIMMGNSQNVLLEHLPLNVISQPFFIVLLFLLIIALTFTNVKVYLREVFMILGLLFMTLVSSRHLSFFYTIGLIYIVCVIYRALNSIGDNTFDILLVYIFNHKVIFFIIFIFIAIMSGSQFYRHSKENYVLKKEYPVDAVKYIKRNIDYKNMRLYNGYNYGSYLLFKDIPVFIDSRCDLYLKEFNGMKYSIFDEMEDINFTYEKVFKKHKVSHVLLSKKMSLYMILLKDIHYITLYEDKNFILFERGG